MATPDLRDRDTSPGHSHQNVTQEPLTDEQQLQISNRRPLGEISTPASTLNVIPVDTSQLVSDTREHEGQSTQTIQSSGHGILQTVPKDLGSLLSGQDMQHIMDLTNQKWKEFLEQKKLPLSEKQMEWLLQNHTDLIERIDVNEVLDFLVQDRVCTDDEQHRIRHHSSPGDSMRDIISHIKLRGQRAYYSFLRAIQQTSPVNKSKYNWLECYNQ